MTTINQESINVINKIIDMINHDFKIPLTSVSFNIQTIKRIISGELEHDQELLMKKIEAIEIKTQQMSRLLEHLVDLTRAQYSELPLKKNLTHTHELVIDALTYTREHEGGALVVFENQLQNQYCTVACDKDRLVQVFSNIIHGLSELIPAKSAIKLSTRIKGEVAQFLFKNEDGPVDEKVLNHIFDKFYIFNTAHKDKKTRASLGLALSKWIIEAHKGSIVIENKEKYGTIFTIELPKMELAQLKATLS